MAYKLSKGNRKIGDIKFEDDSDTGIDFEADTVKIETGGAERLVVTNTNALFNTPIRTTSIEYTDGDDAITIDDGGYLKIHSGIKYSRSVLVSSTSSPSSPDGGWIKFATFSCPGTSGLDTAASSFLVTFAGMESANNRALDGTFMVHAKFTNNTAGNGVGNGVSNAYYEPEGTYVYCEPLNADRLSAAGVNDFNPSTDLLMIFPNNTSTPDVDLYIRACAKQKRCFVTHLGGTGQTDTFDTDVGWTINTGQTWLSSEPAAPENNVKLTGTWASKVFSALKVTGNDVRIKLDGATDSHPGLELYENGTRKWIVYNDYSDDKLVFKTDADVRMVIEQDGKVGIGSASPSHKLDIDGDIRVRGNDIRDNSGNQAISFDGSANTTIVNNLTVQDYTFPSSDGSANQVLQTNGSGQLTFANVSGGGGGGITENVITGSTNLSLASSNNRDTILITPLSNHVTYTLPAPEANFKIKFLLVSNAINYNVVFRTKQSSQKIFGLLHRVSFGGDTDTGYDMVDQSYIGSVASTFVGGGSEGSKNTITLDNALQGSDIDFYSDGAYWYVRGTIVATAASHASPATITFSTESY